MGFMSNYFFLLSILSDSLVLRNKKRTKVGRCWKPTKKQKKKKDEKSKKKKMFRFWLGKKKTKRVGLSKSGQKQKHRKGHL